MFLAAEGAESTATAFTGFDPFVILFTIIIAIGVLRLLAAPKKNLFAIGFGVVSLLVFLSLTGIMVAGWMGML